MENIEEGNARHLKEKYGNNFFFNYLRSRGAPSNIRSNNQLYGLLSELKTILERDRTNERILNDIQQILFLRNENEKYRAIELLINLGLTYNGPQQLPQQIAIEQLPQQLTQRIAIEPVIEAEKLEKVSLLSGIPKNSECPICLEIIDKTGYYTEKCNNFFHKECLDQHCLRKRNNNCVCPMCRRNLRFINARGGKRRITIRKNRKNKSKRNKRKSFKRRN